MNAVIYLSDVIGIGEDKLFDSVNLAEGGLYGEIIQSMSMEDFHIWIDGRGIFEKAVVKYFEEKAKIEKDALDILRENVENQTGLEAKR